MQLREHQLEARRGKSHFSRCCQLM